MMHVWCFVWLSPCEIAINLVYKEIARVAHANPSLPSASEGATTGVGGGAAGQDKTYGLGKAARWPLASSFVLMT